MHKNQIIKVVNIVILSLRFIYSHYINNYLNVNLMLDVDNTRVTIHSQ